MSRWFIDRRQEFIAATLRQFGQLRRADLMREFDISAPLASADIATFLETKPPHVRYDTSARYYASKHNPTAKFTTRCIDKNTVRCWRVA